MGDRITLAETGVDESQHSPDLVIKCECPFLREIVRLCERIAEADMLIVIALARYLVNSA